MKAVKIATMNIIITRKGNSNMVLGTEKHDKRGRQRDIKIKKMGREGRVTS